MEAKFIAPALMATSVLATASVAAVTLGNSLRDIEVHFYDKDGSEAKVIKVAIDSLATSRYFKVKEGDGWKYSSDLSAKADKPIYQQLFGLASLYVRTQHNLNQIKSALDDHRSPPVPDPDGCCKGSCDCPLCLGRYADDAKGGCCAAPGTWIEFQRLQRTFKFLSDRVYSIDHRIYFGPVQAHIKLLDLKFEDLKTHTSSPINASFVGSLSYGFMDYWYRPIYFRRSIFGDQADQYTSLQENQHHFFTNIPQQFSFLFGAKESRDPREPKDGIVSVHGSVEDIHSAIKKYRNATDKTARDCCSQAADPVLCLLNRNYVFLDQHNSKSASDLIKGARSCCQSSQSFPLEKGSK